MTNLVELVREIRLLLTQLPADRFYVLLVVSIVAAAVLVILRA